VVENADAKPNANDAAAVRMTVQLKVKTAIMKAL
jgi:hypothetical protein